jgi:hypothetical protein
MKNFLFYLLFSGILLSNTTAQKTTKDFKKMKDLKEFSFFQGNDSLSPYYMSSKPVTNRDYITYLLWLSQVYKGKALTFYNAVPGLKWETLPLNWNDPDNLELINLNAIKSKTESFVKDYMFNATYIDYPVIGLSWEQASLFCRWLSDRYNEYLLIEDKIFEYDSYQQDESCFTTESYLSWQYEGLNRKTFMDPRTKMERKLMWEDKKLFPSFRLPSSQEIGGDLKSVKPQLLPYPMFAFLGKWWYQSTLNEDRLENYLFDYSDLYDNPLKLSANPKSTPPDITGEWFLDSNIGSSKSPVTEIYKQLGQKELDPQNIKIILNSEGTQAYGDFQLEKDSTGHMPFILIGETREGEPVIVENYVSTDFMNYGTKNSGKVFRVAVAAIRIPKNK